MGNPLSLHFFYYDFYEVFFSEFFFLTVLVFVFSIVNVVFYPHSYAHSAPVCLQPPESVP